MSPPTERLRLLLRGPGNILEGSLTERHNFPIRFFMCLSLAQGEVWLWNRTVFKDNVPIVIMIWTLLHQTILEIAKLHSTRAATPYFQLSLTFTTILLLQPPLSSLSISTFNQLTNYLSPNSILTQNKQRWVKVKGKRWSLCHLIAPWGWTKCFELNWIEKKKVFYGK